jgi:hypothetical protein
MQYDPPSHRHVTTTCVDDASHTKQASLMRLTRSPQFSAICKSLRLFVIVGNVLPCTHQSSGEPESSPVMGRRSTVTGATMRDLITRWKTSSLHDGKWKTSSLHDASLHDGKHHHYEKRSTCGAPYVRLTSFVSWWRRTGLRQLGRRPVPSRKHGSCSVGTRIGGGGDVSRKIDRMRGCGDTSIARRCNENRSCMGCRARPGAAGCKGHW